jgi:hypothetical protein
MSIRLSLPQLQQHICFSHCDISDLMTSRRSTILEWSPQILKNEQIKNLILTPPGGQRPARVVRPCLHQSLFGP